MGKKDVTGGGPFPSEPRTGEKSAAHREEKKMVQVRLKRFDSLGEDLLDLWCCYGHRTDEFS